MQLPENPTEPTYQEPTINDESQSQTIEDPQIEPTTAPSDEDTPSRWLKSASGIISGVFSPLIVPTYCMATAMWFTHLNEVNEGARFISTFLIFLLTCGLPFLTILTMLRFGFITSFDIPDRRQRMVPFLAAVASYIGAGLYLSTLKAPSWLSFMFYGAATACTIAIVISRVWKISAHATGIGGLVGMVIWLAMNELITSSPLVLITVAVMIAGMVGSARLLLHRHSVAQVYAGWILGAFSVYLVMNIV